MTDSPPRLVAGRYELLSELGQGAAGTVWRARERSSGREVALKLIRTADDAARERARREGELHARLDHPGIVRVHALGEEPGVLWLACELVEGARTLDAALPALPHVERLRLVRDAARALGHAHARGVVHRDVKPHNLLVGQDGRVRVTDFGVATALGADRLTRTGALVGTPFWMAPELIAPGTASVGPATDVWGLGVLLYQALTGRLPFEADSLLGLAAQVCEATPARPRALDPAIPPAAEAVCLRALSRAPVDRYADGEALALDLDRVLTGQALASTASSSGIGARAAARARGLLPGALLGAGVLALGGLTGLLLLPGHHDPPSSHATLRAALDQGAARPRLEAALESALRDPPLDPALEAAARRRAATCAAGEQPPAWEAVRAHAARAAELEPDALQARELGARAALALGHLDEARAGLERLARERGAPGDWAALARACLAAGDGGGAQEAVRRARAAGEHDPALAARCELLAGDLDAAEAEVAALGSEAGALLLKADLARARGREAEPLLRAACLEAPGQAAPALALADDLARRGQLEEAAAALRQAAAAAGPARADPALRAWLALAEELLEVPGEARALAPRLAPALRAPIGAWLLREALRDLPGLARADPGPPEVPGARHAVRRRLEAAAALLQEADPRRAARAWFALTRLLAPGNPERRALLERALEAYPGEPGARALLAREHLDQGRPDAALAELDRADAGASWFDPHAQLLLRAEAHLARNELEPAERRLNEAAPWAPGPTEGPQVCALLARVRAGQGRLKEARELHDRAAALEGRRLEEARYIWPETGRAQDLPLVEHALGVAPAWPAALVMRRSLMGAPLGLDEAGLRELLGALRADPVQLGRVTRILRDPLRAGPFPAIDALLAAPDPTRPQEGLLRAWLLWLVIEHRSLPAADPRCEEARTLLEAWLERRPDEALAWLGHGLLALRRGWVARAARDLDRAEALAPGCAGVSFYRALLAVRRDQDAEAAAALLIRAYRQGYPRTDGGRLIEHYPELAALEHDVVARARLETAR